MRKTNRIVCAARTGPVRSPRSSARRLWKAAPQLARSPSPRTRAALVNMVAAATSPRGWIQTRECNGRAGSATASGVFRKLLPNKSCVAKVQYLVRYCPSLHHICLSEWQFAPVSSAHVWSLFQGPCPAFRDRKAWCFDVCEPIATGRATRRASQPDRRHGFADSSDRLKALTETMSPRSKRPTRNPGRFCEVCTVLASGALQQQSPLGFGHTPPHPGELIGVVH